MFWKNVEENFSRCKSVFIFAMARTDHPLFRVSRQEKFAALSKEEQDEYIRIQKEKIAEINKEARRLARFLKKLENEPQIPSIAGSKRNVKQLTFDAEEIDYFEKLELTRKKHLRAPPGSFTCERFWEFVNSVK